MEIVWPRDPNYDEAKQIANGRFDYLRPAVSCYCRNEDDVRSPTDVRELRRRPPGKDVQAVPNTEPTCQVATRSFLRPVADEYQAGRSNCVDTREDVHCVPNALLANEAAEEA